MKSSNEWLKNIRVVVRTVVVLVLAIAFVGILVAPALARDGHGDWDRHHDRGWHRGHRGYYYHPAPVYPAPVYVAPAYRPPPPAVYAPPPPPPSINFVFPIRIR
jgi:hypothetical protein